MNLPNRLTVFRLLMIPLFILAASLKYSYCDYVATAIFLLSAATDGLDGYYARKSGQVTVFGKFMDPLADKILVSAALIILVEMHRLPGWLAVVIVSREFAVTGLRVVAAAEGMVIAARKLGKIKTVTQIAAVVILFLRDLPFGPMAFLGNIAVALALIFTVWSGLDYFSKSWLLLKKGGI